MTTHHFINPEPVMYSVIDRDPSMGYLPGDEVLGTVEARSPSEAIEMVMKAVNAPYFPGDNSVPEYEHPLIRRYVDAIPSSLLWTTYEVEL